MTSAAGARLTGNSDCSIVTVVARKAGSYSLLFRTSLELPEIGLLHSCVAGTLYRPCKRFLVASRNEAQ